MTPGLCSLLGAVALWAATALGARADEWQGRVTITASADEGTAHVTSDYTSQWYSGPTQASVEAKIRQSFMAELHPPPGVTNIRVDWNNAQYQWIHSGAAGGPGNAMAEQQAEMDNAIAQAQAAAQQEMARDNAYNEAIRESSVNELHHVAEGALASLLDSPAPSHHAAPGDDAPTADALDSTCENECDQLMATANMEDQTREQNVVKAAAQVSDENLEPVMGQSVAENDPSTSAAPNAAGAEVSPTGTTTSADAPSAAVNTQGPEEVNMFNSPWQSTDPNAQSPFDPVAPADETLSQGEAPLDRTKNPTLPNEPLTIAPPEPVRPNPAHAAAPDSDDDSFPPSYLTGPVIKQKALAQLDRLMDGMKIDTNKVLHPYQEDPGGAFGIFYPIAIVCHCTHLANQAVQNALIGMGLRE